MPSSCAAAKSSPAAATKVPPATIPPPTLKSRPSIQRACRRLWRRYQDEDDAGLVHPTMAGPVCRAPPRPCRTARVETRCELLEREAAPGGPVAVATARRGVGSPRGEAPAAGQEPFGGLWNI